MITITKYSTPSCMNCKILGMRLKPIVEAHRDKIDYSEVDIVTQGNPLNIQAVPHMVIKKDNEEIFNGHVDNIVEMVNMVKGLVE